MKLNEHTAKQLKKLNDEMNHIQTEMMDKARAIEARLSVIKLLEECEVNGHHWQLLNQPKHNLFRLKDSIQMSCTKCHAFVNSDFKKIYLTLGFENEGRISVEDFLNGREEE